MHVKWIQIVPSITYWAPRFCSELWGVRRLYLTESGCGCDDRIDEQGRVIDLDRVFYLREHLIHLHRAVSEGYPVLGYYLWSFLDNYEWLDGLDMRFGLVHVDFATQKRTPKLSAEFYSGVTRHNCVI